jgi:glycosyltransferase involved in cell wall biosynthesis
MHFDLGVEPEEQRREGTLDAKLLAAMASAPSLLMVGTLEPRKAHDQVLSAVELLWESGANLTLVIVGHRGWLVKELMQRIENHAERGRRLFWLDDADDQMLEAVYRRSSALVAASRGEGYGLPLIEAAQRNKPVIARSLPVFREIAGNYPSYFDTETAAGLATHIAHWLSYPAPSGELPTRRTWRESAALLACAVASSGRSH